MEGNNRIMLRWLLGIYCGCLAAGIFFFTGTGDMGDSVAHFLFARYAVVHPELYFHHWAKPVFVLLASPFAQFGFEGVKVFNALVSMACVYFTYRVAFQLKLKQPWIVALLLICMPLNYILTLSALTEPLFALFTILALYWCLGKKYVAAAVLLSFLPYVRSEGLIVLGVFALYFVYLKQFKFLVFLLSGSVVYGLAGYAVHHDVLWVFTKIPYAHLSSVYGKGPWYHFFEQLPNVVGIPVYILLWLGLIYAVYLLFKKRFSPDKHILIYTLFLCFFVAHSLFWYLGIFNSMGLKRVFLCVGPIMAIMALEGYHFILKLLPANTIVYKALATLLLLYVLVFPFTPNPSAIQFHKDLMAPKEQLLADQLAKEIQGLTANGLPVVYNHYYLGWALQSDRFSKDERIPLSRVELDKLPIGSVIIWDNKLMGWETDIDKSELDARVDLKTVSVYSAMEYGKSIVYAVYLKTQDKPSK